MYEEEEKVDIFEESSNISVLKNHITDHKLLENELNDILNGIPDIIKVYNLDYTVCFFNDAGYSFYNKNVDEVKGKSCYEILGRKEKCKDCLFHEVVRTKEMISQERYIAELNKFMDVCYNPVFDENGEMIYIVERLRDITEKKILDKMLIESKDRYRQVIDSIPDAVVIIVDNIIVLANQEAYNLFDSFNTFDRKHRELVGSNIYKRFQEKYVKSLHKKYRNIILDKKIKDISEYDFVTSDDKVVNIQISYSYLSYEGRPAIIAILRDITDIRQELNKAAEFQRRTLQKDFPAKELVNIEVVYVPAHIVSGDFYRIYKINDNLIVGMIVDVRGKGMTAALSISAFDILCFQEIANTHEPLEIVNNLNKKLVNYYEENYIAVCCFSMDFNRNELKVVGAGINQFIFQRKGLEEKIAEGIFLGMFEDSEFYEQTIEFQKGDKFFFFTDGLDFVLDKDRVIQTYMEDVSITELKSYVNEFLNDTIFEMGKLKDDCTMMALEVK